MDNTQLKAEPAVGQPETSTKCQKRRQTEEMTLAFKCSLCNKFYKSTKILCNHLRGVHCRPIKCPVENCDSVIKKVNLSRHMKVMHQRLRKTCSNCGKKILYINLTRHTHSCTSDGSRPFECPKLGCRSTFKTSADRSNHVAHVHSEPIGCPFPGCKSVMKKQHLPVHVKMVHEKLKKKCDHCGKKISFRIFNSHSKRCKRSPCLQEGKKQKSGEVDRTADH